MKVSRFTLAVAAIAALVATAACSSPSSAGGGSERIKIGAWLPLSGKFASVGLPQKAGFEAYIKRVNAAGGVNGKQIDWITEDNAFDPQQTIQVARTMVQQHKVVAFLAANGTAASQAAFPYVLGQAKVPVIFTYGGLSSWYKPSQPLLFGSQTLYQNQASALGAWAVEDGHSNIVVVHDDPAAYATVAQSVAPGARAKNPNVSVKDVTVKSGTTDYAPIVSQVKALHPDAVVLITPYTESAAYLKAAQLQGLTAQPYGYVPATDTGTIKLAGSAAEGFKGVQLTKPLNDPSSAVAQFRTDMAKYEPSQALNFYSLVTYAEAKAFVDVLRTMKGAVTSQSIAASLQSSAPIITGILPPLTFSATQHLGTNQVQRLVVKNGEFVSVGDFYAPPAVV
jgi:ABC-type branched-subunit amino acid transport system substrate-binding protein